MEGWCLLREKSKNSTWLVVSANSWQNNCYSRKPSIWHLKWVCGERGNSCCGGCCFVLLFLYFLLGLLLFVGLVAPYSFYNVSGTLWGFTSMWGMSFHSRLLLNCMCSRDFSFLLQHWMHLIQHCWNLECAWKLCRSPTAVRTVL